MGRFSKNMSSSKCVCAAHFSDLVIKYNSNMLPVCSLCSTINMIDDDQIYKRRHTHPPTRFPPLSAPLNNKRRVSLFFFFLFPAAAARSGCMSPAPAVRYQVRIHHHSLQGFRRRSPLSRVTPPHTTTTSLPPSLHPPALLLLRKKAVRSAQPVSLRALAAKYDPEEKLCASTLETNPLRSQTSFCNYPPLLYLLFSPSL